MLFTLGCISVYIKDWVYTTIQFICEVCRLWVGYSCWIVEQSCSSMFSSCALSFFCSDARLFSLGEMPWLLILVLRVAAHDHISHFLKAGSGLLLFLFFIFFFLFPLLCSSSFGKFLFVLYCQLWKPDFSSPFNSRFICNSQLRSALLHIILHTPVKMMCPHQCSLQDVSPHVQESPFKNFWLRFSSPKSKKNLKWLVCNSLCTVVALWYRRSKVSFLYSFHFRNVWKISKNTEAC